MTPVMFLGGPLDHTTRMVTASRMVSRRPLARFYGNYELIEVEHGNKSWWIYVANGYNPPLGHVLNTMPAFLKRQEACS